LLWSLLVLAGGFAAPAGAQISVRSRLSDDRDVQPGSAYEGTVLVKNESTDPREVKLYLNDYLFFYDLQSHFDAAGSHARSNADWVTFGPDHLTLAPGEGREIGYVVQVPAQVGSAPPSGSYWSVLMIEEVAAGSPESTLSSAEDVPQLGVRQVTRYGVQLATHIAGTGEPDVAFIGVDLYEDEEGARILQTNVENTGDVMVQPVVWVELYDEMGTILARYEGTRNRMYPGTSVPQYTDVSGLGPGIYEALIVVDTGGDYIFGAQYTVELKEPN
jgi:hypothetical protein